LQVDPKSRLTMDQIKHHAWVCDGFPGAPDNYLEPRPHLTTLDNVVLEEVLKYGFEKDEAVRILLTNEPGPVKNFYHLIAERKRQLVLEDELHNDRKVSSSSNDESHDMETDTTMVTRVENDERVPISAVEKNVRKQMIRRESEKEMFRKGQPRSFSD